MITSERDVFIGAHLTLPQKELFRFEAERRKTSMSALLSQILEKWLETASDEVLEEVRSNKRDPVEEALAREEDVPLPFEE